MTDTPTQRKRGRPAAAGRGADNRNQSLTRALTLLECLAGAPAGLTLTGLSQRLGMPPTTAHRLLSTFEQAGFVEQDAEQGLWYVGLKAFTVGNAFLARRDFVAIARPRMEALAERCGETVNLGIIDDGEVVLISQVESRHLMRMIARLGSRSPVHASGIGKALLAHLPARRINRILAHRGLHALTERTIDSPARLRDDLAECRRRGYALDDEEQAIGLRCVAAAVFDENGDSPAAISISGPKARIADDRLAELGHAVQQTAAEITAALGGARPGSARTHEFETPE